jgi:hypothetical protein
MDVSKLKFQAGSLRVDVTGDAKVYSHIVSNWTFVRIPRNIASSSLDLKPVSIEIDKHVTGPWYRFMRECYFSNSDDATYFKLMWS